MKISNRLTGTLVILGMLVSVGSIWASGATFAITGQGIVLGAEKEGEDGVSRIRTTAVVGKAFTLVAQGLALPRGGKPQPTEPEAGAWKFDAKHFKQLEPVGKPGDKTQVAIRLEPLVAGPARIRFTGKVLGYERQVEVQVEVTARKRD
jgi:hypothetical protein